MRKSALWAIGLAAVAAVGVYVAVFQSSEREQARKDAPTDTPKNAPVAEQSSGKTVIGGIERPETDVRLGVAPAKGESAPPKRPQGFSPPVPSNTNDQVAAVYAALKDRKDPAKFSSFVVPTSFDKEAFEKAPVEYATQYAKSVEPGRAYATAQPGDGVSPLRATSSRFHRVKQGESVRLSVESKPFSPVTFTSEDLGTFDNKLTSVTVVADEAGTASVNFTASGGTVDAVQILAGSPVTSGQVAFVVSVNSVQ